jgi:membrane associated rhomboid family serine protease
LFPLRDNIPTDRTPFVTIALILANVLVYFLWQRGGLALSNPTGGHFLQQLADYGLEPCHITGTACDPVPPPQQHVWLTPFTAMFMHGGLLHLGGNMLFLWIFGNNVEDSMGRVRYVAFYLLGGLAAFAIQIAVDTNSGVPNLGASGAIAAVLGGYILLYPHARVLTFVFVIFFFTVVELPAAIVLGIWIVLQLFDATNGSAGAAGVAVFAHIGGFAFGLLTVKLFAMRIKDTPPRLPVW